MGSASVLVHAAAPPVGSVETSALPASSSAAHSPRDGHEIAVSAAGSLVVPPPSGMLARSTWARRHAGPASR
ncbi:MAG: hypothetical protein M3065_04080 [Actinomycetota bacterium]|nr:hypothetical protein [Actinomycetota bacterium]